MELWELSILIIIVGAISLIAIRMFRAPQLIEKKQKLSKEIGIKEAHAIEKQTLSETINTLRTRLKSETNRNNRLQGFKNEDYVPDEDEDVPPEILKIAAKKLGLNEEALNEPRTVKWIQEQLRSPEAKEMILEYIKSAKSQSTDPYASIAEV